MGELTSGRADIALFPLTLTTQRAQYIQHTQPYMDEGYGLLVRTATVDPGYSFLLPFETFTWLMIALALLVVILLVFVLDSITRSARLKAIERTHGLVKVQRVRKRGKRVQVLASTIDASVPCCTGCSTKTSCAWSSPNATHSSKLGSGAYTYDVGATHVAVHLLIADDTDVLCCADKLMGHAIETVMMAVGSGAAPTTRSCSVKVMFVSWAIFCVIMLSAYTANLTANLTVNQMATSIKTLADLRASSLPFGVPAQSSISGYFSNSSDQGARSLHSQMLEYKVPADAVEAVRQGKIAAYISDYPTVQYFTQVGHSAGGCKGLASRAQVVGAVQVGVQQRCVVDAGTQA